MTTRPGVHLHDRRASCADAFSVVCSSLVALYDEKIQLRLQVTDRALQQCGLSRPRRTNQIECQDFPPRKPGPVLCGKGVVLGQDTSLQSDDGQMRIATARDLIIMRAMPKMGAVVMNMVMLVMMAVIVRMAGAADVSVVSSVMIGWFGRGLLHHRLFPGLEIVDGRLYGISASAVSAHQAVSSSRFGAIAHRPAYRRCAGRQKRSARCRAPPHPRRHGR